MRERRGKRREEGLKRGTCMGILRRPSPPCHCLSRPAAAAASVVTWSKMPAPHAFQYCSDCRVAVRGGTGDNSNGG
jgi:hypothetical protein